MSAGEKHSDPRQADSVQADPVQADPSQETSQETREVQSSGESIAKEGGPPDQVATDGATLETEAPERVRAVLRPRASALPSSIGPYRLLEQLGRGGMGTVYRAVQERPVKRQVALKVVRDDLSNPDSHARFQAERQALSLMDHPNIAKVLDVGSTEDDRPYFVMELVRGVTITEYCEQRRLDLRRRLELFIQACRAIQHAHQKGIIHRDVKPSNILVSEDAEQPTVKVIDFGLAKATNDAMRLTDETVFTQFGQMLGTLQYMSPEQAGRNPLDVDTRSDVYSLGVLLYELLSGSPPLDRNFIRERSLGEVLTAIRTQDPPRPSMRLSAIQLAGSEKSASSQSAKRIRSPESANGGNGSHLVSSQIHGSQIQTDNRKMGRLLRGELDWITIRSLEKDRNRRYQTAAALADDVDCFLRGDVVAARPPSSTYRLGKLANRHRGIFVTAGMVGLTLVLTSAVSLYFADQSRRSERVASDLAARLEGLLDKERQTTADLQAAEARATELASQEMVNAQRTLIALEGEKQARKEVDAALEFANDANRQLAEKQAAEQELVSKLQTANQNLAVRTKELEARQEDVRRITEKLGEIISNESLAESIARLELQLEKMKPTFGEPKLASVVISAFDTLSNVQKELVLTRRELLSPSDAKQSSYSLPIGALDGLIKPLPVETESSGGTRPRNTYSVAPSRSGNVVKEPAKPADSALVEDSMERRSNELLRLLEQLKQASAPTMIGD